MTCEASTLTVQTVSLLWGLCLPRNKRDYARCGFKGGVFLGVHNVRMSIKPPDHGCSFELYSAMSSQVLWALLTLSAVYTLRLFFKWYFANSGINNIPGPRGISPLLRKFLVLE